jgi:ribosome assembly protein 1
MPTVKKEKLAVLQQQKEAIRNICIIAHVDHGNKSRDVMYLMTSIRIGKTTLSDSLLATNGILSSKLAGKVRYLDRSVDASILI